MERLKQALSRVRVRLAISFVLAGVVNLVLLALLGLAITDMMLGRGAVRLVESQLETYRRLAEASAGDLADELAWQSTHGRPSPAKVRERTTALYGLFPGSEAEVVCVGDEQRADSLPTDPPWVEGDGFVDFVGYPDRVDLVAFAQRTYGDCWANVVVRRQIDKALAQRIEEAIGFQVLPVDAVTIPEDSSLRAAELTPDRGPALTGKWWPVVTTALDAETGQRADWLCLRVRPDLWTLVGQLAKVGQRQSPWVWIVPSLTLAVVLVGASSMTLGARISNRIAQAIRDLNDGTRRFGSGELEYRIPERGGGELRSLALSVNTMASDLQRLIEEVKAAERLEEEIRLAREVQEWIYPRTVPEVQGATLAVECKPARVVTGDVYDFLPLEDKSIGVLCADVSGKGAAAALLGASLHSVVRENLASSCRRGDSGRPSFPAPSEVLAHASAKLLERVRVGQYATAFWCDYDAETRTLRYGNAGHLFPVMIHGESGSISRLDVGGVPIGLIAGASYDDRSLRVETGSLLVAFSDGITEAVNAEDEDFGDDRLIDLLRQYRGESPADICRQILAAVQSWQGAQEQMDDMTVVALRFD